MSELEETEGELAASTANECGTFHSVSSDREQRNGTCGASV